jgi:hypothetical protein
MCIQQYQTRSSLDSGLLQLGLERLDLRGQGLHLLSLGSNRLGLGSDQVLDLLELLVEGACCDG